MTGIPYYLALPLGFMVGLAGYGPVKRWIVSLRRAVQDQQERPDGQRKGSRVLLMIFATMHPVPWLLLAGLPGALYAMTFDPLRSMWICVFAGVALGVVLLVVYDRRRTS